MEEKIDSMYGAMMVMFLLSIAVNGFGIYNINKKIEKLHRIDVQIDSGMKTMRLQMDKEIIEDAINDYVPDGIEI